MIAECNGFQAEGMCGYCRFIKDEHNGSSECIMASVRAVQYNQGYSIFAVNICKWQLLLQTQIQHATYESLTKLTIRY